MNTSDQHLCSPKWEKDKDRRQRHIRDVVCRIRRELHTPEAVRMGILGQKTLFVSHASPVYSHRL